MIDILVVLVSAALGCDTWSSDVKAVLMGDFERVSRTPTRCVDEGAHVWRVALSYGLSEKPEEFDASVASLLSRYESAREPVAVAHLLRAVGRNECRAFHALAMLLEKVFPESPEIASYWLERGAKSGSATSRLIGMIRRAESADPNVALGAVLEYFEVSPDVRMVDGTEAVLGEIDQFMVARARQLNVHPARRYAGWLGARCGVDVNALDAIMHPVRGAR